MSHLNEDQLIQYQFDLLGETERPAIEAHIKECDDCRGRLEQLRNRYSALDTLSDEVPPSEELIQKALQGSKETKPAPVYHWKRVGWAASAAAVILIGGLLLQDRASKKISQTDRIERKVAQAPSIEEPAAGHGYGFRTDLKEDRLEESLDVAEKPEGVTPAWTTEPTAELGRAVTVVSADQIPEAAPFAPASAIELVVLPNPDQTQLTIYNSADLTLVRDTRKLTLKAGWNWLQFMWSGTLIDPTSLSIRPLQYDDKIEIEQLVYPARLREVGRWLIRSEVEGAVPFEITYFTSGLSWRAFYMGTMSPDEKTMDLKNYVRVQNHSGENYENAQTRLIVGTIHLLDEIAQLARRQYPYGPDVLYDEKFGIKENGKSWMAEEVTTTNLYWAKGMVGGVGGDMVHRKKEIIKEGLSEYFLYTIEGTETIPNQWAKRLPSLDIKEIPIESLYKYDEDRYGSETIQFVSFANDTEHELGETPLPDGSVKIFRRLNEAAHLSYVGGCNVKYIPVNEEVELNLGPSRLVKVEPKLMETRTEHYTFDRRGNISGWDQIETWTMEIINTRPIPAEMEITRNFGTSYWSLKMTESADLDYTKHDITRARFTTTLPPRSKRTFSYIVTRYHGQRQEKAPKE